MAMLSFFLALAILLLLFMAAVWFLLPVVSQVAERTRIDREAQEASWKIHQQATKAFGAMLDAARHEGDES